MPYTVRHVTSTPDSVRVTDDMLVYDVNGAKVAFLPDVALVPPGTCFLFNNIGSGAVSLNGSNSQTIDGLATLSIVSTGRAIVVSDGSNWFTTSVA